MVRAPRTTPSGWPPCCAASRAHCTPLPAGVRSLYPAVAGMALAAQELSLPGDSATHVWQSVAGQDRVGFASRDGIHILQCRSIVDVVQAYARSITTATAAQNDGLSASGDLFAIDGHLTALLGDAPPTPSASSGVAAGQQQRQDAESGPITRDHMADVGRAAGVFQTSAWLCRQWGLRALGAKFIFDAAYSWMRAYQATLGNASATSAATYAAQPPSKSGSATAPLGVPSAPGGEADDAAARTRHTVLADTLAELHKALQALQESGALENPALLIALTDGVPNLMDFVEACARKQLDTYRSGRVPQSDADETVQTPLWKSFEAYTPMNEALAAHLERFIRLSEQYRQLLVADRGSVAPDSAVPGSDGASAERPGRFPPIGCGPTEVRRLLGLDNRDGPSTACDEDRAQLELFARQSPGPLLDTVLAVLGLEDMEAAIQRVHASASDVNWDRLLGMEENYVPMPDGSVSRRSPRVPLFEFLCGLLYRERPEKLRDFVHFAQAVQSRNSSTTTPASPLQSSPRSSAQPSAPAAPAPVALQRHFYERAIAALTPFHVDDDKPANRTAILACCELLCRCVDARGDVSGTPQAQR